MTYPLIRKPLSRTRLTTPLDGPSMTKQSFKDECDINNIMAKFERTALLEHVNQHQGNYGDFTDAPQDYHEAMNQVIAADDMFQTIPAKLRAAFNNDPGEFLAFTNDPENLDRMRDLGLLPSIRAAEQPPARSTEHTEEPKGSKEPTGNTTAPAPS